MRAAAAILCAIYSSILANALPSTSFLHRLAADPQSFEFDDLSPTVAARISSLAARSEQFSECQCACSLLSILDHGNVSIAGTADYVPIPYWSVQQAEVVPACRVDAESAKTISTVVKVSRLTNCPFNVKSGGHAAFAGGSSIEDGILINLAPMNQVTLSADRLTASIGPGNNWYDVYQVLDPKNVSIIGGREAGVGVGGLTLGGGISYFSGRYGWACDNVRTYEIVLASGKIVNVTSSSHPDLYKALRGGGGSNFGIITRFDFDAFEQSLLWGGSRYYSQDNIPSLINVFANFVTNAPTDDFAHLYIAFGYVAQLGGYIGISGPVYGKPEPNPPIFAELATVPSLVDATTIANLSYFAVAINQTAYQRQIFQTVTFKNSATLMQQVFNLYVEESTPLLNISGFFPAFAFQPISLNIINQMQKDGGNILGLTGADGPLTIMNANWGWDNASDDELVTSTLTRFRKRSVALAQSMGLDHPFIYMNYASQDEDVYAGYGNASQVLLEKVKRKYDPQGVFGRLWPGYFKL